MIIAGRSQRRGALAGVMLLAAGCTDVETNMLQQQGQIRVEPHPAGGGAYRVSIIGVPDISSLSPVNRDSEQGHRDIVVSLLGKRCEKAEIVREDVIPMAPLPLAGRRVMYVLKVTCPA